MAYVHYPRWVVDPDAPGGLRWATDPDPDKDRGFSIEFLFSHECWFESAARRNAVEALAEIVWEHGRRA